MVNSMSHVLAKLLDFEDNEKFLLVSSHKEEVSNKLLNSDIQTRQLWNKFEVYEIVSQGFYNCDSIPEKNNHAKCHYINKNFMMKMP